MSFGRIDMCEAKEPIEFTHGGYGSGHPWYYKLGGKVLSPKQIKQSVRHSGYLGYMCADIEAADDKSEPQRSNALRAIKTKVLDDLVADLSGYRARARELAALRKVSDQPSEPSCADLHMSISLKHNHLFNWRRSFRERNQWRVSLYHIP
jgi:hypothetical protein